MEIYDINHSNPNSRYINKTVDILKKGGLVVYPTDMNYGLGALLSSTNGVKNLNELTKDLGRNKLHTIICRDFSDISKYARVSNEVFRFLKKALPGAYTVILEASNLTPKVCHTRRSTIGVRMMNEPVVESLLQVIDAPLLNFTALPNNEDRLVDKPSDIERAYANKVSVFLNIGELACKHTTVIDYSGSEPVLVRKGEGNIEIIQ